MRLATSIDTNQPIDAVIASVRAARDAGFATAWSSQIFGADALTVFAVVAREVDGIQFGTAVIPVHPRHPQVLAQQALTVQAISNGRLTLGIGLSHQVVVEGLWGYSFDAPATYMREYLDALVPMLHGEPANVHGERVHAVTVGPVGPTERSAAPALMIAALGPAMLRLAATRTDGTVTWMTGLATLRDYIVPTITQAAAAAGRPAPSVIASLPVCCTTDVAAATERIDTTLAIYSTLPSYKAMLDKEGASKPSDVSIIGTKDEIVDALGKLAEAGVTEMSAVVIGSTAEQSATTEVLSALATKG
jgi:5,10-methylenetetrahydromethanopterin reductase